MDEKKPTANLFQNVLQIIQETQSAAKPGEDVDYSAVIHQVEDALDTINAELEEVYKTTGMNKEDLETYALNKDNFSEEEWELLGQVKSELGKFSDQAGVSASEEEETSEPKPRKKKKSRKGWMRG